MCTVAPDLQFMHRRRVPAYLRRCLEGILEYRSDSDDYAYNSNNPAFGSAGILSHRVHMKRLLSSGECGMSDLIRLTCVQ